MSLLEVIDELIIEAGQLRDKVAAESAAKDQGAETATKANKSSAEGSEKKIVKVRKIADGIYEITGVSEDDLEGLKAAVEEIVAREEQRRRREKMTFESMCAPFAREGFIGMMDFLTLISLLDGYIGLMDFLREGAQADQSKNDNDKS